MGHLKHLSKPPNKNTLKWTFSRGLMYCSNKEPLNNKSKKNSNTNKTQKSWFSHMFHIFSLVFTFFFTTFYGDNLLLCLASPRRAPLRRGPPCHRAENLQAKRLAEKTPGIQNIFFGLPRVSLVFLRKSSVDS